MKIEKEKKRKMRRRLRKGGEMRRRNRIGRLRRMRGCMFLLKQSTEDHEEAEGQIDVQSFHVGYFWQGPVARL